MTWDVKSVVNPKPTTTTHGRLARWRKWRGCDVEEAKKGLENELSFTYVSSFCNPFVTSPTSQLILQPFRRFTYVTAHSPTIPSLFLRHSSFSNPFCRFTYVTAHSRTIPLLHLRHSSFSNPSVASPTTQLFLQPFFRFSYVTGSSLTSPGEPPMMFTHVSVPKL